MQTVEEKSKTEDINVHKYVTSTEVLMCYFKQVCVCSFVQSTFARALLCASA